MAGDMVEDPNVVHTFMHDLESAFWVLLYVAMVYVRSSWNIGERSSFIKDTMSPRVFLGTGGKNKRYFMEARGALREFIVTNNRVFTAFLGALKLFFATRYAFMRRDNQASDASNVIDASDFIVGIDPTAKSTNSQQPSEEWRNALKDHRAILEMFKHALSRNEWPDNDPAERQPLVTSNDVEISMRSSTKRSRSAVPDGAPAAKRSASAQV